MRSHRITCTGQVVNLDDLETVARAATPGPWSSDEDRVCNGQCGDPVRYHDGSCCDRRSAVGCYMEYHSSCNTVARDADRDAKYIAAASPDVVLKLIAVARAAVCFCGPDGEDSGDLDRTVEALMGCPVDTLPRSR